MCRFISLMYHNLEYERANSYSVPSDVFQQQLGWLKAEGYVIEGFPGLAQRLARKDFPERYVVLTFDDGHRSNLRAAEMLNQADAQATFFLTRDYCQQRPSFLSDDEIRELARLCSVGSHGTTHAPLSRVSGEQMRAELAESKAWLEDVTGAPITTFSAPGGFIDRTVIRQALELGYTLAGNSVDWWNDPAAVEIGRVVNRITIRQGVSLTTFVRIMNGAPTYLIKRRLRAGTLEMAKRVMPLRQYYWLSRVFYRTLAVLPNRKMSR